MKRKGVLNLSFGMIFSIIMIIAVVGIAVYAITYFINLGETTEIALFHQKFQETVDDIWGASITNKVVSFRLPRGIETVCFGSLEGSSWDVDYEKEYNDFKRYSSNFEKANTNRFIFPTAKAGAFAYKKVDKIDLSELGTEFECFETRNRKIEVRFKKETFDASVKIEKP